MDNLNSTDPEENDPLLRAEQVRTIFTKEDPEYGRNFSETEWEAIAERLSALTRLICRVYAPHRRIEPGPAPTDPTRQS